MGAGVEETPGEQSFAGEMAMHARLQMTEFPLIGRIPGVYPDWTMRQNMAERTQTLLGRADEMAGNPEIGLAMLHLPLPHPPVWYNRKLNRVAPQASNGYLDALVLSDNILGRLRARMESSGVWNRTALLVTSDHGWRWWMWRQGRDWTGEDERLPRDKSLGVPFLLRLPGQDATVYQKTFVTTAIRPVVTAILRGGIHTGADVERALKRAPR